MGAAQRAHGRSSCCAYPKQAAHTRSDCIALCLGLLWSVTGGALFFHHHRRDDDIHRICARLAQKARPSLPPAQVWGSSWARLSRASSSECSPGSRSVEEHHSSGDHQRSALPARCRSESPAATGCRTLRRRRGGGSVQQRRNPAHSTSSVVGCLGSQIGNTACVINDLASAAARQQQQQAAAASRWLRLRTPR